MILDTTSKSVEVILSAVVTTSQLTCVAAWADITTSAFIAGATDTVTSDTTAVPIIAAPAASTQRQVKEIFIYNADTVSALVTVRLNRSSTYRTLIKLTLQTGQTLQYSDAGWSVIDSAGNTLQASQIAAAGADKQIQFNDGGTAVGGDADLTWNKTSNTMILGGSAPNIQIQGNAGTPAIPPSGAISIFGRVIGGRLMAAQVGPAGLDTAFQPFLARNKVGYWNPQGNSTTVPGAFGFTAVTTQGTVTARNVATTNLAQRMRRLGFVSASTVGSLAEARVAIAQFSCGSGSNDGSGFYYIVRWVPSDAATVSGERNFVGVSNNVAAATNVEPSSLTNTIGVAQLSTDATQLYIVYGGSTAQAPIALGTNFPGSTLSTAAFELAIFAPNSVANTYYYQVTNISTGNIATGTLAGNAIQLPQNSTLLAHKAWTCNNATALSSGIDICSIYIETDN
jgi:hypothetical protein